MGFMTRTEKYISVQFKRNEGKLKELKIVTVLDTTKKYKNDWVQNVDRMQRDTPQTNKNLQNKGTKEPRTTFGETSGKLAGTDQQWRN